MTAPWTRYGRRGVLAGFAVAAALLAGCSTVTSPTPAGLPTAPVSVPAETPAAPPEAAPVPAPPGVPVPPPAGPVVPPSPVAPAPAAEGRERAEVVSVVDGDTVKVAGPAGELTLRLIGLDTPETRDPRKPVQCFGREASARAGELLKGQVVELEYDTSQGRIDKYGRTLAYLWLPDGTMYNERMVREGYAHEYTYDNSYRHQERIRAAEAAARAEGRGLWSPTTCAGDTTQPAGAPDAQPVPTGGSDPQFPTCSAARDAGYGPYTQGVDPEYSWYRDGDGDGVTCE